MRRVWLIFILTIFIYIIGFYIYPKTTTIILIFFLFLYLSMKDKSVEIKESEINYKGNSITLENIKSYSDISIINKKQEQEYIMIKLNNPIRVGLIEQISSKLLTSYTRHINIIDNKKNVILSKNVLKDKKRIFLPKIQPVIDFIENNQLKLEEGNKW